MRSFSRVRVTANRQPSTGRDHEWRDGRHIDRDDRGTNQCGPRRTCWRPSRRRAGPHVDHAPDHGAGLRRRSAGPQRWMFRGRWSIFRSSFGEPPQQITLVDANSILYSDDGGSTRHDGTSRPANERHADRSAGGRDRVRIALAKKSLGREGHAVDCLSARAKRRCRVHDRRLLSCRHDEEAADETGSGSTRGGARGDRSRLGTIRLVRDRSRIRVARES